MCVAPIETSRLESARLDVALGVVGHQPFDPDSELREVSGRRRKERGCRVPRSSAWTWTKATASDHPQRLDEVMLDLASASSSITVDPVSAARGHPPELLHVQVDQLARSLAFVAADRCPGETIEQVQPRQTPPMQYAVDGRARMTQLRPKPVGSDLCSQPRPTDPSDLSLGHGTGRRCGALERSSRPPRPSSRCRRSHLWAVARETPDISAARATGQSSSSTR